MTLINGSLLWDLLIGAVSLCLLLRWYLTRNDAYWDKRGVPNVKRGILLKAMIGSRSQTDSVEDLYKEFAGEKYLGYFQNSRPILMVRDPDLVHRILVKDFSHFQDRELIDLGDDPLSKHLFSLRGRVWRAMRYKLTPTFTTGKLKGMFSLVTSSARNMMERMEKAAEGGTAIDAKEFMKVYTVDVIASCAFGLDMRPGSEQFELFSRKFNDTMRITFAAFLRFAAMIAFPKLASLINRTSSSSPSRYFVGLIRAAAEHRADSNNRRSDYLQLLLDLKEQEESGRDMLSVKFAMADATEDDNVITNQMKFVRAPDQESVSEKLFTEESVTGNSFIFLIAGAESVSFTISMVLFELCRSPEVLERLQWEVDRALAAHDHAWTFATVKNMTYLDQVIQEAQRLHPVLPLLTRECDKPYKVDDTGLVIEKGTLVSVPVAGLHQDPAHYPRPDVFEPDRFEGNNFKPSSTFLPFGDGPRMCIAMRFAVMEVKTCLAHILSEYSVRLSPKTKPPYVLEPWSISPALKTGVWLTFERRVKSTK